MKEGEGATSPLFHMELEAEEIQPDGTRITYKMGIDGKLYITKTFDRDPYLRAASAERQFTQGMGWGDGKKIGTIPPAIYGQMLRDGSINDPKAVMKFFKENPSLATFERALK